MRSQKGGTLIFIMDERLSRERSSLLTRTLNLLRSAFEVHLVSGNSSEEDILKKLEEKTPQLIFAPWYRYTSWSRIEAFYGLTRTSGPTFAGYFCEPLMPYELEASGDYLRTILIDFANTSPQEILLLTSALMAEGKRSGLLPLLDPDASVYCENWYSNQGLGTRMDAIMALPEIAGTDWASRGNSIRIALTALWSLVYEQGPGKSEFHQAITLNSPKAYFQVAADRRVLLFRLCYSMPSWAPKQMLRAFWPRGANPNDPTQLLLRYSDFVRAHRFAENTDVEVVAGFLSSRICEKAPDQVHTFWIEPLTVNVVTEIPYEAPSPLAPRLRLLPSVPLPEHKLRAEQSAQARERFIVEAAVKIRELKHLLQEREELIRDLRAGGVGTAPPMPPPDMEALLEAFQERFFEARLQIRQIEVRIAQLESSGEAGEIDSLKLKIQALITREQNWIRELSATIETVKMAQKG